jgi:UDP-glucose 4-epimerase
MRILITGGTGFIGGRLASLFSMLEHEVTVATRNIRPYKDWFEKIKIVEISWSDAFDFETFCHGYDVVIHAAGMNSRDSSLNPAGASAFNGLATERLVKAAAKTGVKRFVYLSTAHVYSDPLIGEINETTNTKSHHPYATSHLQGERATMRTFGDGEINGTVIRLSNVFGVPINSKVNCWELLINNICRQVVETQKIHLNSTENQNRDFITMTDACRVINFVATQDLSMKIPNLLNVGSEQTRSVLEIVKLVQGRALCKFGFLPSLQDSQNQAASSAPDLNFKSIHRNLFANKVLNGIESEIDDLLEFCSATFGKKV